jgi:hypothetical protein
MIMKKLSLTLLIALTAIAVGCGYSSKAATPPQAGAMPAIAELAPNTMTSGGAAFVLTVNGSDFSSKAAINWNGVAQTTSVVSASQLTATIAASDIATPATVPVTVTNPATSGTGIYNTGATLAETSGAVNFTVN